MAVQSKNGIGRLNEYTIHAQLKDLHTGPDTVCEAKIENYIVDVVKNGQLIEIQTKNFAGIRNKLENLLKNHKVLLVAPLPAITHITVMNEDNENVLYKRKSPKKNSLQGIAPELCRITSVLGHPNFMLKVLLTEEEDIRINDGNGSWRRRGISLSDRKLLSVLEEHHFLSKEDYLNLLPLSLPDEFTNMDIAASFKIPSRTARAITYCLKALNLIEVSKKVGKKQFFRIL